MFVPLDEAREVQPFSGRYDTQHKYIQPNDTQHKDIQPNDSQHNYTQYNN